MNILDWTIVIAYFAGMIGLALWLGRTQENGKDYYLGGNSLSWWSIGISTMATQCSVNSLLGAPAFVIAVGGLLWLQYEIAMPLAMIGVMVFLLPFFRRQNVISVYEYLERRFGIGTRTLLSITFQFFRAFATGVTVYGTSLVVEKLIDMPFWLAVLILTGVTIVYDFFGGMKAVVFSDLIQMAILYSGIVLALFFAVDAVGGWSEVLRNFPAEKFRGLSFEGHGLGDNHTFAFLPMLLGCFFLYMSYYGCDQTQVQRELASKNLDDTNLSLFMNGLLRFPLVVTYCLLGVAIGAYLSLHPEFLELLRPAPGLEANYNLAVPVFVLHHLPHGVIGLIIVALFAAAMSSLDSTLNSLSATTMQDLVQRFWLHHPEPRTELLLSRLTTLFWGLVCGAFSFVVGNFSASIIEAINMIGSLVNGSILAVFLLAILTRRTNGFGAVFGFCLGLAFNFYLWLYQPEVSWLWWNVFGCVLGFCGGYLASFLRPAPSWDTIEDLVFHRNARDFFHYRRAWPRYHAVLALYAAVLVLACAGMRYLPQLAE
ncbi:MAG: hypothetical protein A2284_10095 [Deltaproteobacteria bacterium RIFOXYA12_FULL_61_11]|nr:MAG: hypothetical protein A2284_10095 [Deltaproteobacteria bacterium RIFOXYA12_FULL_61_11]